MFPDMGEKTVISIVLLNKLKTISDGDLLDSQRCLMLHGSLIFFTTVRCLLFLQLLDIIL